MKKNFFGWAASVFLLMGSSLDKPAYIIYNKQGKPVEYNEMVQALSKTDIILFGEIHNNALVHWLELQMLKSMFAMDSNLVIGAEMFETDDQLVIDEYLQGLIEPRHLEGEIKLWNNYQTDYKPLLSFARQYGLPFIATNIPRRYANLVARTGIEHLDSLPDSAYNFLPPLPISIDLSLPGYQHMLSEMGGTGASMHGNLNAENIARAQALKDAAMAHFIAHNHREGTQFVHFNGSYHSDNFEGIYWYLKEYAPHAKVSTVSCVEMEDIQNLPEKYINIADFIIALPDDMTKTY